MHKPKVFRERSIRREIEDEAEESERDEVLPLQYKITSYGADYPVDGLVKRLEQGDIFIPPFQRGYVWTSTQASRFIESLLLGLPVPGIFLNKEADTQKLLVIDGQQRLKTLQFFYRGVLRGREFQLRGVQPKFESKTYATLDEEDRRRLDDSIIHATIVRQEEPSEDNSSIYHVFERLNTGGTLLRDQEIRACIYHGSFNEYLGALNRGEKWRNLVGPPSKHMKDQELILRFFALYFNLPSYRRPMKDFLNKFMAYNRHLERWSQGELDDAFVGTIDVIYRALGNKAFRPRRSINAAVFDSVMVGTATRRAKGPIKDLARFRDAYDSLLRDEDYVRSYTRATADEESVKNRIRLACERFGCVP